MVTMEVPPSLSKTISSLDTSKIPDKLRCPICDKFLLNGYMYEHRPFSTDLHEPYKPIRNTTKAFLKTHEKQLADERTTAAAAAAEVDSITSPVDVANSNAVTNNREVNVDADTKGSASVCTSRYLLKPSTSSVPPHQSLPAIHSHMISPRALSTRYLDSDGFLVVSIKYKGVAWIPADPRLARCPLIISVDNIDTLDCENLPRSTAVLKILAKRLGYGSTSEHVFTFLSVNCAWYDMEEARKAPLALKCTSMKPADIVSQLCKSLSTFKINWFPTTRSMDRGLAENVTGMSKLCLGNKETRTQHILRPRTLCHKPTLRYKSLPLRESSATLTLPCNNPERIACTLRRGQKPPIAAPW
jgi:hypothetical protein